MGLQLMLKVPTIGTHAGFQSLAPLLHSSIHDGLIKLVPLLYEAFFQMRNVSYPGLVHTFLQHTPDFVVSWLEIRAVGWPQKWCDEVRRLSLQQRNCFMSAISWSTVLLECEIFTRGFFDCWKQVFHQQYVAIVHSVDLHSRLNEYMLPAS